jgi:hypothetical protein
MQRLRRNLIIGFAIGALVPLFWGVLGILLFNIPEGSLSRLFWGAVYLTCPFWVIEGNKALILMPVLNGTMYCAIVAMFAQLHRGSR